MADLAIKVLNQTHPDFDLECLDLYRAIYEGGRTWRQYVRDWIPKNAAEIDDVYEDRVKRAVYHNYVGGILGLVVGYMFAEPPRLEGADALDADYYGKLAENADRKHTPWHRFWRTRLEDGLVNRDAYIWVNAPAPAAEGEQVPQTKGEEEQLGVGTAGLYLVPIDASQVLDWGEDKHGHLEWLIFLQVEERRADVESDRKLVWRWTFIDGTKIRRWEWEAKDGQDTPKDEDNATEQLPPIEHKMGHLPVVRMRLPKGLWALNLLYDPAIALLRARNDLSWALHKSAHAIMVVKRTIGGSPPKVGHGYYIEIGEKEDITFAEPPGQAWDILQTDVKDLKQELFRVVHQMAVAANSEDTARSLSGESKARDWQATDVLLAAYADHVTGAMLATIRLIASIRGEDVEGVTIGGLDGWQTEDLQTFLESAILSVEAKKLSPLFEKAVAKRQAKRLLGDEIGKDELEEILEEIDESDPTTAGMDRFGAPTPLPPPEPDPEPEPEPAPGQGDQ